MKVLIAGGAGDVGKFLIKDFFNRGHDVVVLDRATKTEEMERLSITYFQGSLTDGPLVNEAVQGIDVVINLAWSFADEPQVIFGEDIEGHIHLLEAASRYRVKRFIYTSTATVYGRAVLHPITETHPCLIGDARKPLYALGKYTAEELCRYYHKERRLPVTIFRFWWAFGENIGGRHLRDLVKKSLNHQPLEMVRGAGGTFVTMIDLGRAVTSAIARSTASGQIYNLGSLFLTWEEIGSMIVDLTHSNSTIQLVPSDQWKGPAFLNEVWDLSWDRAKQELGYEPEQSTERIRSLFVEALQDCIDQILREEIDFTPR
jgi:nucleoside-diphosphate-sugar epimerase